MEHWRIDKFKRFKPFKKFKLNWNGSLLSNHDGLNCLNCWNGWNDNFSITPSLQYSSL
jgi:hypothetical protein